MAGTREIAGRRYALAMLDIARADGALDEWAEAAQSLEALTALPAYVAALQADGLTDEQFQSIVCRVQPGIGEKQLNLFRLLRSKSRLELGPSIASFFRELVDEQRGVGRATVTTAVEIDDARREQIAQLLSQRTGKQIEVDSQVDPEILGGMVVRIGDQLLDGSTRTRLRMLRNRLERAAL
ncbi:MAG: ATP synthase F1 subunit delta [Dehalococcoidia bacterium]|nr:ATP synthase F1 subunit delta [Dehalococcoidia bacterium]